MSEGCLLFNRPNRPCGDGRLPRTVGELEDGDDDCTIGGVIPNIIVTGLVTGDVGREIGPWRRCRTDANSEGYQDEAEGASNG